MERVAGVRVFVTLDVRTLADRSVGRARANARVPREGFHAGGPWPDEALPEGVCYTSTVILILEGSTPSVRASRNLASAIVSVALSVLLALGRWVAVTAGELADGAPTAANGTRAIGSFAMPAPAPTSVTGSEASFS